MEILTGEQMRSVDRRAIQELGIPGLLLMEAAGEQVARQLLVDCPDLVEHGLLVLCGKGNNGGDGLVVARHLHQKGIAVRTLLLARAEQLSGDAATNLAAARACGLDIEEIPDVAGWKAVAGDVAGAPLVLDAMLGTGVRGGARGLIARAIEALQLGDVPVVAIDLPSGVDADDGQLQGPAVRAWRTYTLCRPKPALVLEPAASCAGSWQVLPIGIPDAAVEAESPTLEWLDEAVARRRLGRLARRPDDSHKGSYGHLLAVAGSSTKSGAAVLLARGALRCGVGLITVATPASAQPLVAVQQAEVMTELLPETRGGALARNAATAALELAAERDALAVGPGLGNDAGARALVEALVRRRRCPLVLDADGLNAFAQAGKLPRAGKHPMVLTPHPGEAARLLGQSTKKIQQDRLAAARRLARGSGATVVLKGHRTVIASPDGRVAINSSGNPGMATAGTGDVLTGMIGALLARGDEAHDAARLAVWLHGAAGDRAAASRSQTSLIASDLLGEIPAVLRELGELESPS